MNAQTIRGVAMVLAAAMLWGTTRTRPGWAGAVGLAAVLTGLWGVVRSELAPKASAPP